MDDIEDTDFQSMSLSNGEEPALKKIKRETQLSKCVQLSSHIAKSVLSPILDSEIGNRPIQGTGNHMSPLDIVATMPTLSKIIENQYSGEQETNIVKRSPVKEVKSRKPTPISRSNVLMNEENVESKTTSPISASKDHSLIKVVKQRSGEQLGEVQHRRLSYQKFLTLQLQEAPRMPFFKLRKIGAESKINQSRMHLEITEFIIKWMDQIDKLNKYCTDKYQNLIDIEMRFNRLETIVEEKRKSLSQVLKYDTSAYDSPYSRIENLVSFLKDKKMQLDAAFIKYDQTRTLCINQSIDISTYPFHEKLLEDSDGLLTLINKQILLFNNIALKLVSCSAFIVFSTYECRNRVDDDFKDILAVKIE